MEIQNTPTNYIQNPIKSRSLIDDYDCYFRERNYYQERPKIGFEFSKRNTETTISVDVLGKIYTIPSAFFDLIDEINDSKSILSLQDNWDCLGAVQISEKLYIETINFLLMYAVYIYEHHSKSVIQTPEINPCANGTIDLSWRTSKARMLINIKQKEGVFLASFYGYHTENRLPQEGFIDMNKVDQSRALWMRELKK